MITATMTVDDYIAAHRLASRRISRIVRALSALTALAGIVLWAVGWKFWMLVLFAGLGGILGQWWEDRISLPRKVRKLYAQFKGIADPSELSWDADHIFGRSERGEARRKWSEYVRVAEDEEVILLYITDQLWEAYPKRIFEAAQLEEFRTLATRAQQGDC